METAKTKAKAKKTNDVTVITSLKNAEKGLSVWDNDLVEGISKFNLKPTQLKLVMLLSSKIKKDDTDLPEFTFRTAEFVKVLGFTGKNSTHLKNLLNEMRGKTIRLQRRDGSWSVFGWIVAAHVHPIKPPPVGLKEVVGVTKDIFVGDSDVVKEYRAEMERQFLSGTTTIKLDEEIKPFLIALAGNFTEIELKYILGFKSAHAMQLYILAKKYSDTGWREDDEFALRQKLCKGEYKDWVDFKRCVLKPAIEEINQTDIRLSYTKTSSIVRFEIRPVLKLTSRRDTPAAKAADKESMEVLRQGKAAAFVALERYRMELWDSLTPGEQAERIKNEKDLNSCLKSTTPPEMLAVLKYAAFEVGDSDPYFVKLQREYESYPQSINVDDLIDDLLERGRYDL